MIKSTTYWEFISNLFCFGLSFARVNCLSVVVTGVSRLNSNLHGGFLFLSCRSVIGGGLGDLAHVRRSTAIGLGREVSKSQARKIR